jgi:phage terminase large subunit-like protein
VGSEQVAKRGRRRIALVGRTTADVRDVMVEGESGILAVSPSWNRPVYEPSKRRLTWPNGALATCYSADEPDLLRGPQHDAAACDELASWKYAQETWSNLMFGLRIGDRPQVVVSTTPRPIRILRELLQAPTTKITRGSTFDNAANLAPSALAEFRNRYEGTRIGRQELNGEVLDDVPGALWQREMLDKLRVRVAPELQRIVVAIDPAVTSNEGSDETGIVAAGKGPCTCKGKTETHFFVLSDRTCRASPDGWARRAIETFDELKADRIVAEVNNGGEMVELTVRTVRRDVPYTAVHASRGKRSRAEPIAALYEQGKVHHVGGFPDLEDQLCAFAPESQDGSPDRADALVWALSSLNGASAGAGVLEFYKQAANGLKRPGADASASPLATVRMSPPQPHAGTYRLLDGFRVDVSGATVDVPGGHVVEMERLGFRRT